VNEAKNSANLVNSSEALHMVLGLQTRFELFKIKICQMHEVIL